MAPRSLAERMRLLLVLLCLGSVNTAHAAGDEEAIDTLGWRGTRWEMSTEELHAAFPGELARKRSTEGSLVSEWEIPAFNLAGGVFRVSFYFDLEKDTLQKVSLMMSVKRNVDVRKYLNNEDYRESLSAERASGPANTCVTLNKLMRQKYGSPTKSWDPSSTGEGVFKMTIEHHQWILPTTTLDILSADSFPIGGMCGLTYEPTKSEELEKI